MRSIVLFAACSLTFAGVAGGQATPAPATDTAYVEYHDSPITLPLPFGFRVPSYDRVDGLSLPWGPRLELGENKLRLDGTVTYRSHLGDFDPSINAQLHPSASQELTLYAARATLTNDDWLRGNVANSLASFGIGSDARNYFRADRIEAQYKPSVRASAFAVTPMAGYRFENDWSTGSLTPTGEPWSFFGRTDTLKMRRPNPPIIRGHVSSALGGLGISIDQASITGKIGATVEHAFSAPVGAICPTAYWVPRPSGCLGRSNSSFTQTTIAADVTFPTFLDERFRARVHAILSSGGLLPPQRYGYLGGASSLATVELLRIGGDRLFFAQGDYMVPLHVITLPFLGSPYVDFQYAAGNAGIGAWPTLIQNVGVGVGISYFRAGYTIDPASHISSYSKRSDFSFGISLSK
jgi:hypothetical protein